MLEIKKALPAEECCRHTLWPWKYKNEKGLQEPLGLISLKGSQSRTKCSIRSWWSTSFSTRDCCLFYTQLQLRTQWRRELEAWWPAELILMACSPHSSTSASTSVTRASCVFPDFSLSLMGETILIQIDFCIGLFWKCFPKGKADHYIFVTSNNPPWGSPWGSEGNVVSGDPMCRWLRSWDIPSPAFLITSSTGAACWMSPFPRQQSHRSWFSSLGMT